MGLKNEDKSLKTEKILMKNGFRVTTLDSPHGHNMDSYSKLFFIDQHECSIQANKERIYRILTTLLCLFTF